MTMMSFHIKSKVKVMCWQVSIYLPGSSVELLRSYLICLSSKRKNGLGTQVGPNSPPVLTKGHFVEGGTPRHGGTFVYKEGAPGNLGAMGGEPSRSGEGPFLGCLCLTTFA